MTGADSTVAFGLDGIFIHKPIFLWLFIDFRYNGFFESTGKP